MRESLWITAAVGIALLMSSCSAMFTSSTIGSNDLYRTNNRAQVASQLKAEAEVERMEAEARQAQWEARIAEANAASAEAEYYATLDDAPNYVNIVANDYQSAYARRLYGFESATYNLPSSYYDLLTSSAMMYASAYDPAYYNIMMSGNQVWVEPRYVTSMFGAWGATNVTFGIYTSPWNYGWRYTVDPFYYSWWGYPRYSWYDWNWNVCYHSYYHNWWHGCYDWYYYDHYYHHHHNHHYYPNRPPQHHKPSYRPDHRPGHNHITGTGGSAGRPNNNLNGTRDNSGSRYTSPTSNRNYGKVDNNLRDNNRGTISTGVNTGSSYRESNVKINNTNSSLNSKNSNTRVNNSVSTISGSSNSGSSNSNFRQGSSNSSTRITNTGSTSSGSSNSRVKGNSSNKNSNFRQGGSTSTSRSSGTVTNSSSSNRGGTTSSSRSSNVSSSSSRSSNSSSSYRNSSSSSSSRSSSSSSSFRSSSSSSRSSGYSSGSSRSSSSSSSSRSGGGSTSSRR